VEAELAKLRIEKTHRASRERGPVRLFVIGAAVVVVIAVILGLWLSRSPAIKVTTIRVHPVDVSTAPSDLTTLNATGYVTAAHKVELASKVVGKVAWVGVEMGDKIKKDQALVRLEDDEYKAQVAVQQGLLDNAKAKLAELIAGSRPQEIAQAQALLDQAQSQLENAQLNYNRLHELEGTRSISQQQIDDADALVKSRRAVVDSQKQSLELTKVGPRKEEIDAQQATVRQLDGALALTQVQLNDTVIRAPFDSTVLDRNVEVGEFVTTGFVGDKGAKGYVLSIADLNDLRVELDVDQKDIAKTSPGQPCTITTDAYVDHKYTGTVELISPEANRQKATVLVRVKVLQPDELIKPDMNATVSFLSNPNTATSQSTGKTSIRIPESAVRNGTVYVMENGKAIKRSVTKGLSSSGGDVEIRSGLIGGEDLIVNPPDQLKDGDKVQVDEPK
jgi:HlyD family secretion protein